MKTLLTSRLPGVAAAAAMLFAAGAAQASDATTLAGRAGFLVGHALRCGVAEVRLERSASLIGDLIAAYSVDRDDRTAAQSEFMERVVSSLSAPTPGDPLPACVAVRAQFSRLEQHRPALAAQRATGKTAAATHPARSAAAGPAKSTTPQRAALALKRAAANLRGRPHAL